MVDWADASRPFAAETVEAGRPVVLRNTQLATAWRAMTVWSKEHLLQTLGARGPHAGGARRP